MKNINEQSRNINELNIVKIFIIFWEYLRLETLEVTWLFSSTSLLIDIIKKDNEKIDKANIIEVSTLIVCDPA